MLNNVSMVAKLLVSIFNLAQGFTVFFLVVHLISVFWILAIISIKHFKLEGNFAISIGMIKWLLRLCTKWKIKALSHTRTEKGDILYLDSKTIISFAWFDTPSNSIEFHIYHAKIHTMPVCCECIRKNQSIGKDVEIKKNQLSTITTTTPRNRKVSAEWTVRNKIYIHMDSYTY